MRRGLATAAIVAACIAVLLGLPITVSAAGKTASNQPAPSGRVVLIIAPYLSWDDISERSTPTLWSLAEGGAVADVNARSRNRETGEIGSPLEGALTISSGSWAVHSSTAPSAFGVNERYEVGIAAEAYERMTGYRVGRNRIVFLGLPMTDRANVERSFEVVLGTLGGAVEKAGGSTAAIGNSDVGYETSEQRRVRPAALAAMNERGLVQFGDVSRKLLAKDPSSPFGIRTDLKVFDSTLKVVREQLDKRGGPALVVLDPGDTYRATKFSVQVTSKIAAKQHSDALMTLDNVARLARERFADATIMVVSQSTGDPELQEPEGVGPVILSGPGWSGYATSDSTQRPGLVTNPDVTATALRSLGIVRPVQVIGNPMRVSDGSKTSIKDRIVRLQRMNDTAVAVDGAKPAVVNTFVALTVAVLALSAFALARGRLWSPRARRNVVRALKAGLLFVLVIPSAGWLMFAWLRWPATTVSAGLALLVTSLVLWAAAVLLWWRSPVRVPVAAGALFTSAIILVDQWFGAQASFTNFFGYSPLLAARFYGMGNEAAAIVFGATVVGVALLFDQWPQRSGVRVAKRIGLPLVGLIVVFTAAAPFWGANIGVAIWGTVGFGLAFVLMNGHHVSWKLVFWLFLGAAMIIAGFAAIDLFSGGPQTHVGRAITSAEQGGIGELWTIVARKAETNARVLTRTNWAYILLATLAFLGFMRWRPQGGFGAALTENPDFADAITVSLAAGLVAYFTEDSGIVIPALEVFYVGIGLAWLMLSRLGDEPAIVPACPDEVSAR